MTMKKSNHKSTAYSIIKDRIIDCIYPPGSFLNEAQLASELSISRTPIREAIGLLEREGLVSVMVKKGIYVSDIQITDVHQIFQARLEIEPISLRLAAPHLPREELLNFRQQFQGTPSDIKNGFRLDTAMHLFIIEHCGNHFIIDMMHTVFDNNTRVIISSKQNQVQIHDARSEHTEIIDLLLNEEFAQAEEKMREHIMACRNAALNYFYQLKPYYTEPVGQYKKELEKLGLAHI